MAVKALMDAHRDEMHNLELLYSLLPPKIVERLKNKSDVIAEQHKEVRVVIGC